MGSDGTPGDVVGAWIEFLVLYVGGSVVAFLILVVIATALARLVRSRIERRALRSDGTQRVDTQT